MNKFISFQVAEFTFLYLIVPVILVFTEDVVPIIPTLWIVVIVVGGISAWRTKCICYNELWHIPHWSKWSEMLQVFLGIAILVSLATAVGFPDLFLEWPPGLFTELATYTLLSVPAQQLIFTFYLSRRHRAWWQNKPGRHILVTAMVFGWAHLVFMHPVPMLATALIGALICYRYQRNQSLPLAITEHALYGNLVFLIGFGSLIDSANV